MDRSKFGFKPLTVSDYQYLRGTTGWESVSDEQVEAALNNELFSVCITYLGNPVGMGRIVGDGSIYFYIQDVIAHPDYKKMGIGTKIMEQIEDYLKRTVSQYAFIGLMAAEDVAPFYEKFGFGKREGSSPGMFKIIRG